MPENSDAQRTERPGHQHAGAHTDHGALADPSVLATQEFWDQRYGSVAAVWSGNPNPHLVTTAAELTPGTAVDVGCGEGADAIWLASHGWHVTGIDVSPVALERAAKRASEAGDEVAKRITWRHADILAPDPATAQFDLVSAHFVQLPKAMLSTLHRQLAAAVRPGGTLLIVGHDPADLETTMGRPHLPDAMFTADQAAAVLDPDDWKIVLAGGLEREAIDPEGRSITIRDAVLRAVRHG